MRVLTPELFEEHKNGLIIHIYIPKPIAKRIEVIRVVHFTSMGSNSGRFPYVPALAIPALASWECEYDEDGDGGRIAGECIFTEFEDYMLDYLAI